jgi:hydrogenase nickel incorporation protein HypA/HybF
MHELSICQSLIQQVENIAQQRNAHTVSLIVIGIGPLSGVEAQLLKNAYPIASAGTIADQAELTINTIPLKVKCNQCGKESEARPNKLNCRHCGNWQTQLLSGDELMLLSVELEKHESNLSNMTDDNIESGIH